MNVKDYKIIGPLEHSTVRVLSDRRSLGVQHDWKFILIFLLFRCENVTCMPTNTSPYLFYYFLDDGMVGCHVGLVLTTRSRRHRRFRGWLSCCLLWQKLKKCVRKRAFFVKNGGAGQTVVTWCLTWSWTNSQDWLVKVRSEDSFFKRDLYPLFDLCPWNLVLQQ